MISVTQIIKEEVRNFIKEYYDEEDVDNWTDEIELSVFNNFLYRNNADFTRNTPWKVIPFPRLKKIWEDYIRVGVVRDTKGLNMIENIAISNTIKINLFTELAGHTQWGAEEKFKDNIGYWVNEQLNCILPQESINTDQLEIPYNNPSAGHVQKEPVDVEKCNTQIHPFAQKMYDEISGDDMSREEIKNIMYENMKEKFFDYFMEDPKSGQAYISDYGLQPLMTLMRELTRTTEDEQKISVIDRMLNVVHQRSDIASWFVQGGSRALSDLSGYNVPDEESSNSHTKSAISGRYEMGDYY